MKNQKKNKSGGAMKLSVWSFVIFVLISIGQILVELMLPKVGEVYFHVLGAAFVLQMLAGITSIVSFIISCIKRKIISFGFVIIIMFILGCVIGEGYRGIPYIKDFKGKTVTVTTSNYSVIGKKDNKILYFSDDENNEEAFRLNDEMLKFLEDNNAIDINNTYVNGTSYLHHISSVNIEYYPNTEILKKISVVE